jgi:serine protease Do
MAAPKARIVIRHLSGSKINQIEQFDLEGLQEITIGRDPGSKVAYDQQRDDEVSRRHAVIRIRNDKELYFRIADANSSNGTFLNGERIAGEVELLPEDTVELGSGGPKFIFDVQPRPANLPARTRQMSAADAAAATRILAGAAAAGATLEQAVADTRQRTAPATASTTAAAADTAAAKVPVGKATILRMLSDERRKASHIWIGVTAALLVLGVVGGGALFWRNRMMESQFEQKLAEAQHQADLSRQEADTRLKDEMGITPADIKRLGDATVYIYNSWQLYDNDTNRPVYQKMVSVDHRLVPAFVKLSNGDVVRWLTLDQTRDEVYQAVGNQQSGSGFVFDSNGYILTNIHVASSWAWRFQDYRVHDWTTGAVYNVDDRPSRHPRMLDGIASLSDYWVPGSGGYVFEPNLPHPISGGEHGLSGRNGVLTVRFPGTRTDFNATLVKISPDSDVAEIKIDATNLSKLDLADDGGVGLGDKIILLGYPGMSNQSYAEADSNARGITRFFIPEPTVTEGVVAKLPSQPTKKDQGEIKMKDKFGNMYQLDISAGSGTSGGPVLDKRGKVIGLMSMGLADEEHVSFAVPVANVHEMLRAQR